MKKITLIIILVVLLAGNVRAANPFTQCLKSHLPLVPGLVGVTFANKGALPLKFYWIDYSGKLVLYHTLSPGQSYIQGTYAGHPWLIKTPNSEDVAIYIPLNNKPSRVEVRKSWCTRT